MFVVVAFRIDHQHTCNGNKDGKGNRVWGIFFVENDDFIVATVNYGPMLAASITCDLDDS